MQTISQSKQNFVPILASLALTLGLWLASKWAAGDTFADPFKYPAKAASLSATVLMCWCILLSTRARRLETYFGGLDKVYQVHKRVGRWAFFTIIAHPVCLAVHALPDLPAFAAWFWFVQPADAPSLMGRTIGVALFWLMTLLVALTLWLKPPYHIWKKTHEYFGLVLVLVLAHVWWVQADVAAYPLLTLWLYGWMFAALGAFAWIRLLYPRFGPRHAYQLTRIERQGDILDLTFTPTGAKMDFKPSQFVYLVVHTHGISEEPHPYSIASGYNLGAAFKLGVKMIGDHTRSLAALEPGDPVTVYGPYGTFSTPFLAAETDCVFIGGGIGITPFIGMWHVALHSEERLPEADLDAELRCMHPELIRSWKSPRVALFYVCRNEAEASFDADIRREVILSHFHGFNALEERGHHYELYLSAEKGRFSADYVARTLAAKDCDLTTRTIFLCGPSPMTDSLTDQFLKLGIPRERIVLEDFNLV